MSFKNAKESITIVGREKEDKNIINFLKFKYDIIKIYSLEEFNKEISKSISNKINIKIKPEIIIFGKNLSKTESTLLTDIFFRATSYGFFNYYPKFLSFGSGSILLGELNGCDILKNITNHEKTNHLVSFCLLENKILEFIVNSNHTEIIYPKDNYDFRILAFSSHNISQSYTNEDGNIFKAERNFIEIEGIKLLGTNSYCFLYEEPSENETILIDLTSKLINR